MCVMRPQQARPTTTHQRTETTAQCESVVNKAYICIPLENRFPRICTYRRIHERCLYEQHIGGLDMKQN